MRAAPAQISDRPYINRFGSREAPELRIAVMHGGLVRPGPPAQSGAAGAIGFTTPI